LNWNPRIAAPVGEPDGLLHRAFGELAGTGPAASVYLEQYAHGSISSGMISPGTWRERFNARDCRASQEPASGRPNQNRPGSQAPWQPAGTLRNAVVTGRAAEGP
jgi:hypothetical protein